MRLTVLNTLFRSTRLDNNIVLSHYKITLEELSGELTEAFGAIPTAVEWTRKGDPTARTRTALVAFRMADVPVVPKRVSLFGDITRVELRIAQTKASQYSNYHDFHR